MGLYPRNLNEYVASLGIPRGPNSQAYLVDTEQGNDSASGTNWGAPMLTLEAAEDKCVADRHDTVVLLSRDTECKPAAAIAWDKDFTHLVGYGNGISGVGQRSRIVGTAALDLAQVITFAGKGCLVKNIQIFNENDAAADSGAAIVSGGRNFFENVFFAGMGSVTAGARAGSYSLALTGEENTFKRCSIGLQTIIRAAANAELLISGASPYRNKFIQCEFLSWSVTAAKLLVKFVAGSVPWTTQFEDCLWENLDMTAGGADGASIDNAIGDSSTAKHQCILRGKNMFVGCTGVADTLTNIYSAEPVPSTGFGLAVNPAA
jgi:hypothetical protein